MSELGQEPIDVKPEPDDLRYWSVTTIIGALDKPALVYWSANETAKAAVADRKAWLARLENEGEESAIEYLKGARFRRPRGERSAAQLGTEVHAACEQYALSGTRPDVDAEVAPFVDQFDRFLQEWQPEYQATEVTVYSPTYGYAGTCDGFLNIDGQRLIIDYKTSRDSVDGRGKPKGPYPEVALQLAAYRYAELAAVWRPRRMEQFRRRYYLLSQTEREVGVPVPEVDGGAVIYLTPDRYALHTIRCDEAVHQSFLFTLEAARWVFQLSNDVVGSEMTPPREVAA